MEISAREFWRAWAASLGYGWLTRPCQCSSVTLSLLAMRNLTALLWQRLVTWDHLRGSTRQRSRHRNCPSESHRRAWPRLGLKGSSGRPHALHTRLRTVTMASGSDRQAPPPFLGTVPHIRPCRNRLPPAASAGPRQRRSHVPRSRKTGRVTGSRASRLAERNCAVLPSSAMTGRTRCISPWSNGSSKAALDSPSHMRSR